MIPAPFEYLAPATLAEAVSLLARHGDEAKLLSGGQSLIPMLKLRLATPAYVVDLNGVADELGYVREERGLLRIGALAREADLERAELIGGRYPLLADAAAVIADPLVRNLATVCGNVAHADPANDHPAAMLALEAEVVTLGPDGERRLPVDGFFTGPFSTRLMPAEIITELRIPIPPPRSGGAYLKLERKVGDFATAAVAVQVTLDTSGVCRRAGIGLTNVGPTAIRATRAELALVGSSLEEEAVREAARLAAEEAEPTADYRGSAEYKRDLVRVLTGRGVRRAFARALGLPLTGQRAA